VSFVCAAANETPIAILLDDLQWADEASLDLVQRLTLQTRGARVLLLGTYRDEDVQGNDPLERTLRNLYRAGLLERIHLDGLSRDGTRALIAAGLEGEVPEDVAAAVYRQTEGNPFYTQEILHAFVERGEVYRRNGDWEWREIDRIEVPATVRTVLGERLSRLEERTRELLGAASVLGQTFHFDELQALSGYSEQEVEDALDEAVQHGIVREAGDQYSFQHALTQAALYGELSGRRKRRLHLAAGETLEALSEQRREGRDAELAWHFLEGDDRARALVYSLLAGDAAEAVFAHGEARQHYQRARDLAREVGDETRLREALRKLGAVLNLMGRYDAAAEALEEAVQLAREAGDLDGEIDAVTCILRHAPERGNQSDAVRWVAPLLLRLEDYPVSPRKLAFFNAYAYFLIQTIQFEEGLRVTQQAVEMAGALGDEGALARAKVVLGHLLLWHGRFSETETLLAPAVPHLEDAGNLPDAMRAASLLAQVDWFRGDVGKSLTWRERSLRLARQVGDTAQAVYETCMLGYLHLRLGDPEMAWKEGLQAVAEAEELDRSTMAGSPLGLLATLSCMQGTWDELERYTGEMISLSEHSDEPWWRRHGELIRALRDLLRGHPEHALARLEPLVVGTRLDMQEQTLELPALAEAHLKTGNLQRARELLEAPLALRGRETRGMLTDTLRVYAMLLRAGGDHTGAEAVLDELLDITRSMPYPFAEAQALAEYARLEAARNHLDAAREHLEQALAIFRQLAAQPFIEQIEQTLLSNR
jgi:tetratricopeptide (TPR) repeat protein